MGFLPIGHEFRQMSQEEIDELIHGENQEKWESGELGKSAEHAKVSERSKKENKEMKNDRIDDQITIFKPVTCGAHSLRYYVADGWTYESVQHLYEGKIKDFDLDRTHHDENGHYYAWGYYTPDPTAKLKLTEFKAHVNMVKGRMGVYMNLKEFFEIHGDYYIDGVV